MTSALFLLALVVVAIGTIAAGEDTHPGRRHRFGHGQGHGAAAALPDHRPAIHALLADHEKIQRRVETVEGGVVTVTTSEDPAVAEQIRVHVRQMKRRMEQQAGIRHWDPLFVELFRYHDRIAMTVEDVPGGVRVTETSDDPWVARLIHQHAVRGVSEFVASGFDRAHQATPLPDRDGAASAPAGSMTDSPGD